MKIKKLFTFLLIVIFLLGVHLADTTQTTSETSNNIVNTAQI